MVSGGNKCSLLVPLYSLSTRWSHLCTEQKQYFVRKLFLILKTAKQLKRWSREAVLSPSLKIFKVQGFQDKALNNFV